MYGAYTLDQGGVIPIMFEWYGNKNEYQERDPLQVADQAQPADLCFKKVSHNGDGLKVSEIWSASQGGPGPGNGKKNNQQC